MATEGGHIDFMFLVPPPLSLPGYWIRCWGSVQGLKLGVGGDPLSSPVDKISDWRTDTTENNTFATSFAGGKYHSTINYRQISHVSECVVTSHKRFLRNVCCGNPPELFTTAIIVLCERFSQWLTALQRWSVFMCNIFYLSVVSQQQNF